ncbi:MAG: trypsin-like peptidase domain-containing protein [Alcanivoracaceae bacterium]|nr:trypsin-like peptidase domain-containing protein [Alcanivoracaceae bacterium]
MKSIIYILLLLVTTQLLNAKEFTFPSAKFIEPVQESATSKRIIGVANFEKIRDLADNKKLYNTARRVAFLNINNEGACTGTLVGPDLILTNAHCVMDLRTKRMKHYTKIKVAMEYLQKGIQPTYQAQVIEVIKVNPRLDYSLLKLNKAIGRHYGWLELADEVPTKGDVMVIQHPSAREKEVSRVQSSIVKREGFVLHYYADTEPGSSGSPVFNLKGIKLIALHHAGACIAAHKKSNNMCSQYDFNEGIDITKIKKEIAQYLPSCAIDGDFPGKFVNKCVYLTE